MHPAVLRRGRHGRRVLRFDINVFLEVIIFFIDVVRLSSSSSTSSSSASMSSSTASSAHHRQLLRDRRQPQCPVAPHLLWILPLRPRLLLLSESSACSTGFTQRWFWLTHKGFSGLGEFFLIQIPVFVFIKRPRIAQCIGIVNAVLVHDRSRTDSEYCIEASERMAWSSPNQPNRLRFRRWFPPDDPPQRWKCCQVQRQQTVPELLSIMTLSSLVSKRPKMSFADIRFSFIHVAKTSTTSSDTNTTPQAVQERGWWSNNSPQAHTPSVAPRLPIGRCIQGKLWNPVG